MKHSTLRRFLSALCAMVLALTLLPTAWAAGTPAVSKNQNENRYPGGYCASNVNSYLYQNASGGLTRVEYLGDKKIVAEDYSSSFQLQSSRTIPFELSKWGGFFAGSQYNFIVFGQENLSESDSVEVIRVVKYDKSWKRLDHYSLYGSDIQIPFKSGSLRCAEYNGYLYIHTCRTLYKDSNGLNHQSSVSLQLRESDMTKINYVDTYLIADGCVGHSFNQFILVDADRNVVMLDHGDATPRALVLSRPTTKAGPDPLRTSAESTLYYPTSSNIWEFPGEKGANSTGATAGGLAETRTGYVSAFNRDDVGASWASRKVYLGYTDKATLTSSVTQVSTVKTTSVPHLAQTSLDGGWILFNDMEGGYKYPNGTLHYAAYNATGQTGAVQTAENAPLSDCAPIQYNGKTVWYTTNDSAPVFYMLDANGLSSCPANGSAKQLLSTNPASVAAPAPIATPPAASYTDPAATFASEVLAEVNYYREKAGVPALQLNDALGQAAQIRAKELISVQSITRPDGSSFRTVLNGLGVNVGYCGETFLYNELTNFVGSALVDTLYSGNGSDVTKPIILSTNYTHIGVGKVQDANGRYFYEILFGQVK